MFVSAKYIDKVLTQDQEVDVRSMNGSQVPRANSLKSLCNPVASLVSKIGGAGAGPKRDFSAQIGAKKEGTGFGNYLRDLPRIRYISTSYDAIKGSKP